MTKVAVGCPDLATLARFQRERWSDETGDRAAMLTARMPTRADELVGGSLFWIIAHRLVARQQILGLAMADTPWGPKCRVDLVPGPVPVIPTPRRAHQGWRYLDPADAPPDGGDGAPAGEALPAGMMRELQALWLL